VSGFEGEGCAIPAASRILQRGTEIDSAIRGFQLTNAIGFAFSYVDRADSERLSSELTLGLDNGHAEIIDRYHNVYLDCEGDIDKLTQQLAIDIHRLWGAPEPRQRIVRSVAGAAKILGALTQASIARAVGDKATETKLRALVS
jgi:hypothetical protein